MIMRYAAAVIFEDHLIDLFDFPVFPVMRRGDADDPVIGTEVSADSAVVFPAGIHTADCSPELAAKAGDACIRLGEDGQAGVVFWRVSSGYSLLLYHNPTHYSSILISLAKKRRSAAAFLVQSIALNK